MYIAEISKGEERARLARDSYSYLHLPMVASIVLIALGIKKILADVGDPLGTILTVALCGGVALYLLGHSAFRLRDVGSVSVPRLVMTILCAARSSPWRCRTPPSSPSPSSRCYFARWPPSRRCDLASSGASSADTRSRKTRLIHRAA